MTPFRTVPAVAGMLVLSSAPALAQDPGHEPGEAERALEQQMLDTNFPGFMGQSRAGFTSRFDPSFNPAIGLVFDALFVSDDGDAEDRDRLALRTVEVNVASRIDPFGWAYVVAPFEEEDGEREFELEEAAMWFDRLPARTSLRAGRYLSDFGKWNTLHQHDRSFVFPDGVRGEYFGGNLNTTGIEVHQWFGVGDVPVRWSLGVATEFGGHGHGHGDEHGAGFASGVIDGRGTEEYGYHGRLTAQHDVGQNGYFQWGVSLFTTPEGLVEELDTDSDGDPDRFFGLSQTTAAVDLTLRRVNAAERTADTVSLEIWANEREGVDPASLAVSDGEAAGIWGHWEHSFDPRWSAGVVAGWWQHADAADRDWFTGDDGAAQRGAFVTYSFSEFNRLRAQVTQEVHGPGEDSVLGIALQWTVILGSHSHPLDW